MCVEIQKDRMKLFEVVKAFKEYVPDPKHESELAEVIFKKFGVQKVYEEVVNQGMSGLLGDRNEK
jgi:hypothetical protein